MHARRRDDRLGKRPFAGGKPVGPIERRPRRWSLRRRQGRQACVEGRDQRLAALRLADLRGDSPNVRANVVQAAGDRQLDHRIPELAQQEHRRSGGEGSGDDEVGIERQNLLGQPVVQPQTSRLIRHARRLRLGGEVADRGDAVPIGEQHEQLVGAEVHRHDALRPAFRCDGLAAERCQQRQYEGHERAAEGHRRRVGPVLTHNGTLCLADPCRRVRGSSNGGRATPKGQGATNRVAPRSGRHRSETGWGRTRSSVPPRHR